MWSKCLQISQGKLYPDGILCSTDLKCEGRCFLDMQVVTFTSHEEPFPQEGITGCIRSKQGSKPRERKTLGQCKGEENGMSGWL